MWIVPLGSMLLAVVTAPIVRMISTWRLLDFQPDGARVLVGAVVSSGLSFIVFTFSILLVAVQIASSNLSPRVIAPVLGAPPVKVVLGVFIFAYTYSAALGRVTAVEAIDQIHRLLRLVGMRDLSTGRVMDGAGHLRLVYRTLDWDDFVGVAVRRSGCMEPTTSRCPVAFARCSGISRSWSA